MKIIKRLLQFIMIPFMVIPGLFGLLLFGICIAAFYVSIVVSNIYDTLEVY